MPKLVYGACSHTSPLVKLTKPTKLANRLRVRVYEKPASAEALEGIATLHRKKGDALNSYYPQGINGPERIVELWSVTFDGESRVVDRWVCADDIV